MTAYEVALGSKRFTFTPLSKAAIGAGCVVVQLPDWSEVIVDYKDLREFARAAMDATTDALVAAAVAEGKVST